LPTGERHTPSAATGRHTRALDSPREGAKALEPFRKERNADLLQWSVLKAFYSDQVLAASRAREVFMPPETDVVLSAVQSVPARA